MIIRRRSRRLAKTSCWRRRYELRPRSPTTKPRACCSAPCTANSYQQQKNSSPHRQTPLHLKANGKQKSFTKNAALSRPWNLQKRVSRVAIPGVSAKRSSLADSENLKQVDLPLAVFCQSCSFAVHSTNSTAVAPKPGSSEYRSICLRKYFTFPATTERLLLTGSVYPSLVTRLEPLGRPAKIDFGPRKDFLSRRAGAPKPRGESYPLDL